MKTRPEYRAQAREILNGDWKNAAIAGAIYFIILMFAEVPALCVMNAGMAVQNTISGFTSLYAILVAGPLGYALYCAFLSFIRGEIASEGLLQATTTNFTSMWSRIVPTYLLMLVIILALSIVTLGIAGIIFSYAYQMVPYLLKDYPELGPKEVLRASREMMKGHKWDFFVLQFSFIGWMLLSIITLGFGLVFLIPYMATTNAYYYNDLRAETIVEETEA